MFKRLRTELPKLRLTDVGQRLRNISANVTSPRLMADRANSWRREAVDLEHVLDSLPAAIIVYEADGTLLRVNRMAAASLGGDPDALVGRNIKEFRDSEHTLEYEQIDAELLERGEPILERDFTAKLPSGETRILNTSWLPVLQSPTGQTDRIYSMAIDVTEARLVSQELQHSEGRMRTLNEQLMVSSALSGVGYWHFDLVEDSVFWSPEVFRIHGRDPEEGPLDFEQAINDYHPDDRDMVASIVEASVDRKEAFGFDARIIHPDGAVRHVRSTSRLLFDSDGDVVSVLGAFQDTTESRQREADLENLLSELSRSNEELNRFSYVCSHDMKEPVRMIETMSNLLLDPEVNSDESRRQDLLQRINKNMVRLRSTIDSLLAYSRLDAKVEYTHVDLQEVAADVIEATTQIREDTKATVTYEGLPTVVGARVHFVQLFQNLIVNALKYTDKDAPLVKISAETHANTHVIRIEDNGPGIPIEDREKAFDLFGRLDSSLGVEGVGVGLSICYRIVSQYEGRIEAVDGVLGGAAFDITLPVVPTTAEST